MRTLAAVVIAAALALAVAAGTSLATRPPAAVAGYVEQVEVTGPADNVLRGELTAVTDGPVRLAITLRGEDHELVVTEREPAVEHSVPLLGLRPDRRYEVLLADAEAEAGGGEPATVGAVRTEPLPDDMPPIEVITSEVDRMAPGLTMFNQVYRSAPGEDGFEDEGWLTAVDETGEVVWYHRERLNIQDANRLDDGDLLVLSDETGVRQLTPTGEVVAEWRGTSPGTPEDGYGFGIGAENVIEVDINSMHHDAQETDDGDILTLSRLIREVEYDEPLCEGDDDFDGTEDLVGEAVVLYDKDSGEVIWEYSLFDVIDPADDPRRPRGDYCVGYLDRHFPDADPRDWTHSNAVTLSPDGRTYLVSARHTDEMIALRAVDEPDGPAGSLRWQLGPDGDFDLTAGGLWFWHPHAPEWLDDDTVLIYDNGNGRLDADRAYSRAVIYDIDTDRMTATQVWEHVMPDRLYASFLGDSDMVDGPSGDNVLITHGGQISDCDPPNDDERAVHGEIVEVERASGEIVFHLATDDFERCVGWAIYRAERIPQIHPAELDVEVVRR